MIFTAGVSLAIVAGFLASAGACYGQSAGETLANRFAGEAAAGDTVKFAKGLSADHKQYHPHATKDCALLDPYFFINGGKFDAAGHAQDMERDRQNCPICNPPKPTVQPTQPPTPAPAKEKPKRPQAQKPIVQPLPPPVSTKDVDRLHDELSQRDRAGTSQDAKSGTKTDEAIPTPTTQKERGGKSSVSEALDGLSEAYGEKKGVDALTQVFGPLPEKATPSDALKQVFGDLPQPKDANGIKSVTPLNVPSQGEQDYWQSKTKVLEAATGLDQKNYTPYFPAAAPNGRVPANVSRILPDGGMISISPSSASVSSPPAKASQFLVNGMNNDNKEVIDRGILIADKTETKTTLIYNEDQRYNPADTSRIWDRQFAKDASDASTDSARKLASETESRLRAGENVRWVLHSAGVIEGKLAYATVKERIMSDSDLASSQKAQMLGSISILALGGGDKTATGFEGVGSLHTVVDKNDFVANTAGDGVGAKFSGNTSTAHPLEHYMNAYDGDKWWRTGKTVINSDNGSVVGRELGFPSNSRR